MHVENNCRNPTNIMRYLRGIWWGADPRLLILLYRALVRSRIEYAGFLLHDLPAYLVHKLDKIQYDALRIAMGYRLSTPRSVISAEVKEPPFYFTVKLLANNFISKVLTIKNHSLTTALDDLLECIESPVYVLRRGINTIPLLESYREIKKVAHLLKTDTSPTCFSYSYDSLHYVLIVEVEKGFNLQDPISANTLFKDMFGDNQLNSFCFFHGWIQT